MPTHCKRLIRPCTHKAAKLICSVHRHLGRRCSFDNGNHAIEVGTAYFNQKKIIEMMNLAPKLFFVTLMSDLDLKSSK